MVTQWLNNANVRVQQKLFDSTITTSNYYVNPWATEVPLQGTDGWQFSPDLPESGSIYVYTPEVSRPLSFMYTGDSDSAFNGFETLNFSLDPVNFLSSNAANADFYITADGTTNLTSTY